jgi:tetratricopeptide (TPR) repeat protein
MRRALSLILTAAFIFLAICSARAGEDEWMAITDKGYELYKVGKYDDAIAAAREALRMGEELFGPEDLKVVGSVDDLASYLSKAGRDDEAEPLYRRALAILEKNLPPDDSYLAIFMDYFALFLDKVGKKDEADGLRAKAKAIRFGKNRAVKEKQK